MKDFYQSLIRTLSKAYALGHFPVCIGLNDNREWELYDLGQRPDHIEGWYTVFCSGKPLLSHSIQSADTLIEISNHMKEGLRQH